jgi:MscS family membrane protein
VVIGDKEGTVQSIGLRSTRIRTFYDSVLTIPNSTAVSSIVDNMGMRSWRRVKTHLPPVASRNPMSRLIFSAI